MTDLVDPSLIAAELRRWRVPAVEVVAVRDGEVLMAGAYGERDRDAHLPASPTTLFHHGSITKAFTAMLAASLVDAGLLEWDRPVRDYLPTFRLGDPVAGERATIRDLLAHRSGIAQHDMLWLSHPTATPSDLVGRLRHLGMGRDFRAGFLYSNLGYAAAGEVIAEVTGTTWAEALTTRILKPLGMTRTYTSVADTLADDDHARPYRASGERDGHPVRIPYRVVDAIAAAGAVISCAPDMARWLLAQTVGAADVVSSAGMQETRRVQVAMAGFPPPLDQHLRVHGYGLGWVVGAYRGEEWLWHSGGVDGFWSHAAVLPAAGAGVVVSANVTATQFPFALMLRICDRLLALSPRPWLDEELARVAPAPPPVVAVEGTTPSHPLADYAGAYEDAGYGTLTITVDGTTLGVRLGASTFETAHRHYDTWTLTYPPFPELPLDVTFHAAADGAITEAWVPLEGAIAPIRFRRGRAAT